MRNKAGNVKGFTFIEVLMAIMILGAVLVPILGMFTLGLRSQKLNEQRLIVVNLLQRKMEEIKVKDFAEDVTQAAGYTYSQYEDYGIEVTQLPNYDGNPYLKHVKVYVRWVTPTGQNKEESLATLLYNDV